MGLFGRKNKSDNEIKGSKLEKFEIDFADLWLGGKFADCVELAESFSIKYPNNIQVIKNLNDAYTSAGNYEKNKIMLENAIKYYPKNPYIRRGLANSCSELSLPEMAVNVLREGLGTGLDFDSDCSEKQYTDFLERMETIWKNDKEIKQIEEERDIMQIELDRDQDTIDQGISELGDIGVTSVFDGDRAVTEISLDKLDMIRIKGEKMDQIQTRDMAIRQIERIHRAMKD
jgi:tetratricopeptide (TPR) repeat protein